MRKIWIFIRMFLCGTGVEHRITPEVILGLRDNEIFVFGSKLSGEHSGGASAYAKRHFGAIEGRTLGRQGKSYAIPALSKDSRNPEYGVMNYGISKFITHAKRYPGTQFYVTLIGREIMTSTKVAPSFRKAIYIDNISLPKEYWEQLLK